ncbi:MAG: UDP-N-acetylmuramoyl-tripeptide--D-alanyl-D-alanine ligase [Tissierellia bacterium]|nr:UDP-N-acetylmuramoyl-tripeptide--D-alanyl-D-alanine ligase [Tissierellia bacterium]
MLLMIIIVALIIFVFTEFQKDRSRTALHVLQLEEYNSSNYKRWVIENSEKIMPFKQTIIEDKSPLVMTDRAKRLFKIHKVVNMLILALVAVIITLFLGKPNLTVLAVIIASFLLYYYEPYVMILSNNISVPREVKINMGYYYAAEEKLKSIDGIKVVGITGSFGKTSTKFITGTILDNDFKVQNTPSSFNTPMGLSKIINNELTEDKEVFIAEMGARIPGEIKELTDLVHPSIGVITSIGPTHMETFKTIETIIETKYELIEELPEDGIAIFNYDNHYVKTMADRTNLKKILYGMDDIEKLDLYATDIKVDSRGSSFNICTKGGKVVNTRTVLLGKHNISNILAGAAVGLALGLSLEVVADRIKHIEPIEHRLNIVDGGTGVIIIDDAFNSNPVGARAALEVINEFKDGRKIIVTPGMVELGDIEEEENYKFGLEIAKVCNFAILVGIKRTEPIKKGIIEGGFNSNNIFSVNNLDEATQIIGKITVPGDVVLFENDLPDNYSED